MSKRRARHAARTLKPDRAFATSRSWRELLITAGLVVSILIAYSSVLRGAFIWDDDFYVSANQTLRSLAGLHQIWFQIGATPQYYPLVFTTFWAEYHVFGLDPLPYHVTNILLHAVSAVLVWRIGRTLHIPGALAAAFLFGLHPVHVESVAWITERKNTLSGVLYLSSMLAFLHYRSPQAVDDEPPKPGWYALALVLFLAALFSKTVTATLPAALLLIYWWKTGRLAQRHVVPVLPMIAAGAFAGALTAWIEKHHVGTKYIDWNLSFVDRTLIASRAVWFYLGKIVWPAPLTFIYPRWQIDARDVTGYLYLVATLAAIGALFTLRGRFGRGPLVALLFFIGTLFPALGFIDVFPMRFSFVADHFQYLASLGPLLLVGAALANHLSRSTSLVPLVAAAGLLLAALTHRQGSIYENPERLWRDTVAKNPEASIAHINLGAIFLKDGRLDDADRSYRAAIGDPRCLDRADVLRNLGLVASRRGDREAAIAYFERAVAENPSFATAWVNLGEVLRGTGRLPEATTAFERAVASDPNNAIARNNLGSARFDADRLDEAVTELQSAVALEPAFAEAHYNLGNVLAKQKKVSEAQSEYLVALRIRPEYVVAHINLANLLLKQGRADQAIVHLETALEFDPQNALAHYSLGYALNGRGRSAEAADHIRRAQLARPDLAPPSGLKSP